MGKTKLSIVLVNYNAGDFLVECLRFVYVVEDELDLDVWVVDNASEDDSIKLAKQEFPQVHYIENKDNRGFGAANNQALKQIKNEYILILNPDTEVEKNTLSFMVDFMEKYLDVGAATCRALKSDGELDWAYHRGFPTPWASFLYYFLKDDRLYHLKDRDMSKAHEVDAISGSFFLTRKSVLDKVGLFDEDYWMYAEDLDLSFRIKRAGLKVMYVPDVQVVHLKGVSSGLKEHSQDISTATKASKLRAFDAFYETMNIFYRKNLASSYPFFINWAVYLAINLKWAMAKRKMSV
ncbi:MAG: Glycosyl transferase family 2 [Candidatus Daviesbacteria bacterium GW2011_GWA2_42_7]|uniref:Glycosyl transferase family 2 n=2 Tax=Candidatus Daviesiibacteriota TaxID=1752718 RepID=A0A0G1AWI5_9BACT|nr:MAG: Glycosyl transferase family 2 [Candidatus Daviesbacteria bacterium GW2011_GWA1_42_6]KKS70611.1 MAG: Glycosyl transferase family 2 [Candidatus Daviesbacteria bacterium GW2011_GWA2_42_7]